MHFSFGSVRSPYCLTIFLSIDWQGCEDPLSNLQRRQTSWIYHIIVITMQAMEVFIPEGLKWLVACRNITGEVDAIRIKFTLALHVPGAKLRQLRIGFDCQDVLKRP